MLNIIYNFFYFILEKLLKKLKNLTCLKYNLYYGKCPNSKVIL
jgi:hypothetical protein